MIQVLGTQGFFLVETIPHFDLPFIHGQNEDGFTITQGAAIAGTPLKSNFVPFFDRLGLHRSLDYFFQQQKYKTSPREMKCFQEILIPN